MSTAEREHLSPLPPTIPLGELLLRGCGLFVTIALLAAGAFSPDPPSHGAPDSAVLAFYQQHAHGLAAGAFLWDLAMMAMVVFSVVLSLVSTETYRAYQEALARCARRPLAARLLPPLSAITAALFVLAQAVQTAGGVLANRGASAGTVRALDEISHIASHLGTLPMGCFILAAALAQYGSRSAPRWVAWLGLLSGSTLVVTTSWIIVGQQWMHDAGVIGLLLFMVWIAASSIVLLRVQRAAPAEHLAAS